ncbi:hypothetical protein GCM10011414_15330 [Croceivirga lutea]|uniref:transaldolase n=1 Tax=Croceivirga lutea TaxID=1775167 RepID=UPI001639C23F|nr:transaldolase [Croceivirga lutea]GGG46621.1 hypothetical protein GCM10011414_15330 [Croceivirga lutea]
MKNFYLLLACSLLFSCNTEKNNNSESAYFAGEIVNPTSDYVVLYKDDIVVDSAKIDTNNQFKFVVNEVNEGLHHFNHAPELQYVYLEKGDSIIIRLNTNAFDESLVFSGTNQGINNFLIEMFLNFEDEERYVNSLYKLKPTDFSAKIDSLRTLKNDELKDLIASDELSKEAASMAMAAIDYNSYIYKEKYPFYHKKHTGEETIHALDDNYYQYRKKIDLNHNELVYFRPYYDYMKYHFSNLSYMSCLRDCGSKNHTPENYIHLNNHKLKLIDSTVENEDLRNNLFRSVAVDALLKEHKITQGTQDFVSKYEGLSTNEDHKQEIQGLVKGIRNLQSNNTLPNIILSTYNGEVKGLPQVVSPNKNVIYFWSGVQKKHFRNVHKQIATLKTQNPDLNFIGICLRTSESQWKSIINESGLSTNNQFLSSDIDEVRSNLIIDGFNKCVITKDTIIKEGFGNLYSSF